MREFPMIPVQLEEADYSEAIALHKRWGVKMWLLITVSTAVDLIIGFEFLFSSDVAILGVMFISLVVLTWIIPTITKFVLIPSIARKRFKQHKALQRPYTLSWSKDALTIKSETGENNTPWSDFLKWRENEHLFLIYVTNGLFRMIPKRAFSDSHAATEFGQLLHEKIGPRS